MVLGKRPFWYIQYGSDCNITAEPRACKRPRVCSEEELLQLDPIAERVLVWLRNNPNNIPKTEDKLAKLLVSLCKISVTVDTQIIYYHLLLNGLIQENCGNIEINNNFDLASLRGFILDGSGLSPTLSIDFCSTLKRVVGWTISHQNPPKTRSAFFSCLKQLCTFRREVPVSAIITWLKTREYIATDPNGKVQYSCLSNLQFSPVDHYMAH